eukprot:1159240-Pelagomonas_calceolata.AAC.2
MGPEWWSSKPGPGTWIMLSGQCTHDWAVGTAAVRRSSAQKAMRKGNVQRQCRHDHSLDAKEKTPT